MTYYPDLSPYQYSTKDVCDGKVLNVGWLGSECQYPVGEVSGDLLEKLLRLCEFPINRTRGFHLCPFCASPQFGFVVKLGDREILLGSAEIRMTDPKHGIVYVAPDLIYHYVKDHGYKPPDEFLRAL